MLINLRTFKGATPLVTPRLLPEHAAQTATNCKTDQGTLRPIKGYTTVNTPSKAGTKTTIFKYGNFWLHWLEDVDVVRGPIAGDTSGRIYWTGEGVPKVSDATIITAGGGTGYPTNSYTLGLPVPDTTPTGTVVGASVDPTLAESRSYVYTYVTAWGEESVPSSPSVILDVEPTQSVSLTTLGSAPTGSYNITHKRIYRTATGTTGTEFQYVATVTIATATYSDSVATANLGEAILSTNWDAPPDNLHSLKLHPSGFLVGISNKDICFSVQYIPHAWPEGFRIPIEHQPIGLGIFGNTVLVLTEGVPYAITGTDPEFMLVERLEINQACVSKRGIVDIGNAVAYPSPDGLIVIGSGVVKNATEGVYTRDQWQSLLPDTIDSAFHDGCYYGFSNGSGILFDFADVKTISVNPTACYVDAVTDTMYLQVGANIVSFDDSGSLGSIVWKSKVFVSSFPAPIPGVGQVKAANYPLTLKLYADGTLRHTQTISSEEPFRIAGGLLAKEFEIQIESTVEVYSAVVASTMAELRTSQ